MITGGHDIEPVLYAQEPEIESRYDPERERVDYTALINHLGNLTDAIQSEPTAAPIPESAAPMPRPAVALAGEPSGPDRFAAQGSSGQGRAPTGVAEEPGYDAEIAAIFTEESAELLEAAEVGEGVHS